MSPKPSTAGTIENSKISPISSSSKSSRRRANRRKRNLEDSQGSGGANKADEQRLGRERELELAKIELDHQELKRQQQKYSKLIVFKSIRIYFLPTCHRLNEAKRARERSSDHDLCADVDRKRPRHFGTPPPPRFDTSLFG